MTLLTLADFLSLDRSGGLGRVAWESAKALSNLGHESIVVEPRKGTQGEGELISGVMTFHSNRPAHLGASEFLRPRNDLVDELIDRFEPSVVIIHGPLSGWTWARCRRRADLSNLAVFHSAWGDEYRVEHESAQGVAGGWLRDRAERRVIRRADKYLTLSAFMADRLAQLHRVPRAEIRTVPGGVDLEHFSPGETRSQIRKRLGWRQSVPTLISVRNLRPRMGLGNLLEAIALVLAAFAAGPLLGAIAAFAPSSDDVAKMHFYRQAAVGMARVGAATVWQFAQLLQHTIMHDHDSVGE